MKSEFLSKKDIFSQYVSQGQLKRNIRAVLTGSWLPSSGLCYVTDTSVLSVMVGSKTNYLQIWWKEWCRTSDRLLIIFYEIPEKVSEHKRKIWYMFTLFVAITKAPCVCVCVCVCRFTSAVPWPWPTLSTTASRGFMSWLLMMTHQLLSDLYYASSAACMGCGASAAIWPHCTRVCTIIHILHAYV